MDYQSGQQLVDSASMEIQLGAEVVQPIDQQRREGFRPTGNGSVAHPHSAIDGPHPLALALYRIIIIIPEFEDYGVGHHDSIPGDLHPHLARLVSCTTLSNFN